MADQPGKNDDSQEGKPHEQRNPNDQLNRGYSMLDDSRAPLLRLSGLDQHRDSNVDDAAYQTGKNCGND